MSKTKNKFSPVAGVPKGKTAASVKWMVPVVEDYLIAAIEGREEPRPMRAIPLAC
jgi:hypothetical protein